VSRPAVLLVALVPAAGCEPYRIEYHQRPEFYEVAAGGDLPDEVTLADGTTIVYESARAHSERDRDDDGDAPEIFEPRKVEEDGSIVLRALMPEHVLMNTMGCLYNEEYDLLWEQVLAERTRREYAARGEGFESFQAFFARNRVDLARTLNRMVMGLAMHDVVIDAGGDGMMRYRFQPRLAALFRFTKVYVVNEDGWFKLMLIE
jgi:hypothetical protein